MFAASLSSRSTPGLGPLSVTLKQTAHAGLIVCAITATLYLGNVLSPALAAINQSFGLQPLQWLIMATPTLTVFSLIYLASRRLTRASRTVACALAVLPFAVQSLLVAPLSHREVLTSAQDDGGSIPAFHPTDVLAIMDMPARQSRGSGLCSRTCVDILQATSVEAIFLPRTYIDDLGEASGVIYQIAPRGRPCDVTVALPRRAQACLTTTPARLSQATHILSLTHLDGTAAQPTAVGRFGGLQIRLIGAGHTRPIFQETGLQGRSFSRLPLIGDPQLSGPAPYVAPRFLTREINQPMHSVSLIEWLGFRLVGRPIG